MEKQRKCASLSEIIRHQPQASSRSRPSTGRRHGNFEKEFIRKREREYNHQQQWNGQVKYYEKCKNDSDHYECWTSPRYYETHSKVLDEYTKKKKKEDDLIKRREKLQKLLEEDERSYAIEMMVRTRDKYLSPRETKKCESPATSILREVNLGIQQLEEDRRRHEAEIKLYHQWRANNPIVRHHERLRTNDDVKLSWLDQQIEKRMEVEKAEEECRKILAERDRLIEEEKEREQKIKKEIEEKNRRLMEELQKQMEELKSKQQEAARLDSLEIEEMQRRMQLLELEDKQKGEVRKRMERETALFNVRQYRLKLKHKAQLIDENLQNDKRLIEEIKQSQIAERIEDERKRREIIQAMDELLKYTREQIELERKKQQYLSFVFDSEAKDLYEKQEEIWNAEEAARKQLLEDVLASVRAQIDEKIERNREHRKRILEEKDEIEESIRRFDEEIKRLKEEEDQKTKEWKKEMDMQIKQKTLKRKELKLLEQKRIQDELEATRKEEERLMREIAEIQKRPYNSRRSCRSNIFLR
ncbi:trichoplein keratin filament-binding protein-like isoform X2 [Agrilus planipennis]|uniref:Trichoplein keratin filament-binding protein-like isoform X2 n=1 Tax=Agrilus planipennis TaxID=224129 RepID=A0A1W4XL81_AGRPL|nr:trichoplein keratin filament-binding protein-like isoform X2 [Agrilus planipennis]